MNRGRDILLCIVHFGEHSLTNWAIESIRKGSLVPEIAIVSREGDLTHSPFYDAKLIVENENRGYSSRLNVAAEYAIGEGYKYVIFSNNDVVVESSTIEMLYAFLRENPDTIAGPVILREDQRIESAGIRFNLMTGRHYNLFYGMSISDINRGVIVADAVAGTFMMMQTEIVKRIRFDENYSFYFEDVDFCLRARQNNIRSVVIRDAIIVHKGRSCISRLDMYRIASMVTANHIRTFEKHSVLKGEILRSIVKKGIVGMNLLYFLLRGNGGLDAIKGVLMGEGEYKSQQGLL